MFIAAMLLSFAQASGDGDVRIDHDRALEWSSGPWRVFPYAEEGSCDLGYSAPNGEYVTVAYGARQKAVQLLITNRNATSIDHGQVVRLTILFLREGKIVSRWPAMNFETRILRETERAFVSPALALSFLDDFAKADFVGVMTENDAGVGGAILDGSAEAVRRLRACGFGAAGLNAKDPFLK